MGMRDEKTKWRNRIIGAALVTVGGVMFMGGFGLREGLSSALIAGAIWCGIGGLIALANSGD